MSSSAHANNKLRSILVLGKDFIQGIDNTTSYTEKMYSTSFTVANKKFCLSFYYNGDNSYLFTNGKKIINFKAKDCPISIMYRFLKDFSPSNIHKTGLSGYVYDFSVDYWTIANDKILDIHKYLMKKNNIV